jgi:hypothetical protein
LRCIVPAHFTFLFLSDSFGNGKSFFSFGYWAHFFLSSYFWIREPPSLDNHIFSLDINFIVLWLLLYKIYLPTLLSRTWFGGKNGMTHLRFVVFPP